MIIGNKEFKDSGKTYIMGILNVTPDSFSDGGRFNSLDSALYHTEEMIHDGADIIDIGGESTRPGYEMISDQEEIDRVTPVLEAVKARFDIPVSIDTYKSAVAEAVISSGADLINDIWGLKYDSNMSKVIADGGVSCCLMHNAKKAMQGDPVKQLYSDLKDTISIARAAGIADDRIMLDPGVGFAKDTRQNLITIEHMDDFLQLGYPMLLGTSRKSVIGNTLNLPKDEREEGTLVTTVMAVMKGYSYVRVHNVKANKRAVDMTEAILYV